MQKIVVLLLLLCLSVQRSKKLEIRLFSNHYFHEWFKQEIKIQNVIFTIFMHKLHFSLERLKNKNAQKMHFHIKIEIHDMTTFSMKNEKTSSRVSFLLQFKYF